MILEYTNRAQALQDVDVIFGRIQKGFKWFSDKAPEFSRRWMELASDCYVVQKFNLWREKTSKETGKPFATFREWINEESGRSHTQVYRLIGIVEDLPLSKEEMGELGQKNCQHLAVLARSDKGKLRGVIEQVRKTPNLREKDVRQLVYSALDGQHVEAVRYEYLEFAIKRPDLKVVQDALKVMQEYDRLDHPGNPTGRGRHLVFMVTDWLQSPEQLAIVKKLRKDGVIDDGLEVEIDESDE